MVHDGRAYRHTVADRLAVEQQELEDDDADDERRSSGAGGWLARLSMGDSFSHQSRVALRHGGGGGARSGGRHATEAASLYPSADLAPSQPVNIDALARRPSRPSSPVHARDSRVMEQNPRHSSLCYLRQSL